MDLNLGKENFKGKWPNWMEVHVAFEKMMKAFDKVKAAQLKRQKKDACGLSACVDLNKESEMENVNKMEKEMEKKILRQLLAEDYMKEFNEYDAELCADNDIETDYDYWAKEYADEIAEYKAEYAA